MHLRNSLPGNTIVPAVVVEHVSLRKMFQVLRMGTIYVCRRISVLAYLETIIHIYKITHTGSRFWRDKDQLVGTHPDDISVFPQKFIHLEWPSSSGPVLSHKRHALQLER